MARPPFPYYGGKTLSAERIIGLYDRDLYPGWHRLELSAGTGNGGEWRDRTEVLWANRPLGQQPSLFDALGEVA